MPFKINVKFANVEEMHAVAVVAQHLKLTAKQFIRAATIQAVNSIGKQIADDAAAKAAAAAKQEEPKP